MKCYLLLTATIFTMRLLLLHYKKKDLPARNSEYYQFVLLKMLCESVIPKAEPIITSVGQCLKS